MYPHKLFFCEDIFHYRPMLNKEVCNYLDVSRTLGIYFVILGHFMYTYHYNLIPGILNSFHMPMFFMISGMLHKPSPDFSENVKKTFYSLIIPYILYNLLAIAFLICKEISFETGIELLINLVKGTFPVAESSWFLFALFFVKIFAFLLDKFKHGYILFSLFSLVFFTIMNYLDVSKVLVNSYMIKTACFVFPFFAFGYLSLKYIDWTPSSKLLKPLVIVLLMILNIVSIYQWGVVNVVTAEFTNVFHYILQPLSGALAVILFSQLVIPFVKCNFIKDISRGTMIIVGIHSFIMSVVLSEIFFGVKPLRYIIVVGFLFLLSFYIFIKLTYKRCPILYGKWRPTPK